MVYFVAVGVRLFPVTYGRTAIYDQYVVLANGDKIGHFTFGLNARAPMPYFNKNWSRNMSLYTNSIVKWRKVSFLH